MADSPGPALPLHLQSDQQQPFRINSPSGTPDIADSGSYGSPLRREASPLSSAVTTASESHGANSSPLTTSVIHAAPGVLRHLGTPSPMGMGAQMHAEPVVSPPSAAVIPAKEPTTNGSTNSFSTAGHSQSPGAAVNTPPPSQPTLSTPTPPPASQPTSTTLAPPPASQPTSTAVAPPPASQPISSTVAPPFLSQPTSSTLAPPPSLSQPIPSTLTPPPASQPTSTALAPPPPSSSKKSSVASSATSSSKSDPVSLLSKEKLEQLAKSVDPNLKLDEDVQEFLQVYTGDLVDEVTSMAVKLAQGRKSQTVDVQDVKYYLEHNWNMFIPGFGADPVKAKRKLPETEAHKNRQAIIKKHLKKF